MSDIVLTSGKPSANTTAVEGTEAIVDPSFGALRITPKPIEYQFNGHTYGHYSMAASTGAVSNIAAGAPIFSLRWTDSASYLVLERIRISMAVVTFATAQAVDVDAIVARGFTASDSAGTQLLLTANSNKARSNMASSLVTDARVAGITNLTAGTRTLDSNPFAIGAAPGTGLGAASGPLDLYSVLGGQHPVVLAANEGIVLRAVSVIAATFAVKFYIGLDWVEVNGY